MKSLTFFVFGVMATFFVLSNQKEIRNIKEQFLKDFSLPEENEVNYSDYDPSQDERFSDEAREYFKEIVKKSEYSDSREIKRWESDVRIYVMGQKPDYLMTELDRIVLELNELIYPIDIQIVNSKEESNFIIVMDSCNVYNEIEKFSEDLTKNNWGLFAVYYGASDNEIHRGNMYVDVLRCRKEEGQKHLLREELTQSLGLSNDSYDYPESIFYQGWTTTTEYAPIDRELIQMLYNYW